MGLPDSNGLPTKAFTQKEALTFIIEKARFFHLAQPVFGRGSNKARLKSAQVQQEIAAWNFRQSLLDAGVEVNNAITLWQTAQKRVELDKKQILNLQAAVWNTQLLMKHGSSNYLEVLSAQKNLLNAELAEVSDRFDEIQSIVNLYHALGGGYDESDTNVL